MKKGSLVLAVINLIPPRWILFTDHKVVMNIQINLDIQLLALGCYFLHKKYRRNLIFYKYLVYFALLVSGIKSFSKFDHSFRKDLLCKIKEMPCLNLY